MVFSTSQEGVELDLGVLDRGDLRYPSKKIPAADTGGLGQPGRSPCVLRALVSATAMDFGRYL